MSYPPVWISFFLSIFFIAPRSALSEEPNTETQAQGEVKETTKSRSSSSKKKPSNQKKGDPLGIDLQDDPIRPAKKIEISTIGAALSTPSLKDIPRPPVPSMDIKASKAEAPTPSPVVEIPTPGPNAYILGVGDLLKINVWAGDFFEEDFKGDYIILDSGVVDLPLIGRVVVTDLSEEGAAATIANALRVYIVNPIVQVQVTGFNSKRVSVLGAVQKPGVIQISGQTTLLEALAERQLTRKKRANGAWAAQKIHLHRKNGGIKVIDLEALLATAKGNAIMEDGDMIYVSDGAYVYINGKVKQPGPVPFRVGMTITDAIAEAGGSARGSNLAKVYIMRGDVRKEVNVKRIFQGQDKDVGLKEGDRLFIEESIW